MKKSQIEIDEDTTVIIEVSGGAVIDYYTPDGIHVIVVDHDVIKTTPDRVSDTEWAAKQFLENLY